MPTTGSRRKDAPARHVTNPVRRLSGLNAISLLGMIEEGVDRIDWTPDKTNSISSTTGRLVHEGRRAAEVRPSAPSKEQIAALLDLLDLHLSQAATDQQHVDPDQLTLRVPVLSTEARGAIGTLVDALVIPVSVQVLELDQKDKWADATTGWDLADVNEYERWPELLSRPRPVPSLVSDIVAEAALPGLRGYPMLSTVGRWSLRLEGLEVGRANAKQAKLGVGKDGRAGDRSRQREFWVGATGHATPLVTADAVEAARVISTFAAQWHSLGATYIDQDEHALESRILRGAAPIEIDGKPLSLIRPDPVVNWGSQFPTKWGPGGKSRYLDALLRDGSTPWAIEMKVQGGAGVGQYYRHAVAQAVLYREFIRRATPLHDPWFVDQDLDATWCEAAVVVPRLTNPRHVHWRDHVLRLCEAFNVAFVEVDPEHALRH